MSQARTVDGEDVTISEIGNVCAFLMSDLSAGLLATPFMLIRGYI